MAAQPQAPIILIKRRRKRSGAHHGGSWKVAYADFVTAMMAFFMVMWLVAQMPQEQLGGIADYFKNPSAVRGRTSTMVQGKMGPGGAGDTPIKMFQQVRNPPGAGAAKIPGLGNGKNADMEAARKSLEQADKKKLEILKQDLQKAIGQSQALKPFKDQLLIDITPEGLRIQIIDAQNRPMFDSGSPELKSYTRSLLVELARYVDQVPNRVAISGHTDTARYAAKIGYSNWELSADRANAARRALIEGGMREEKLARVVGLSSSVPFNRNDPADPKNRRISLVVLSQEAERIAAESDEPRLAGDGKPNDPPPVPKSMDAGPLVTRKAVALSNVTPDIVPMPSAAASAKSASGAKNDPAAAAQAALKIARDAKAEPAARASTAPPMLTR
ncbi:motility protein MotB [Lysobacter sp. TY2-98]|uniref:flagellar motor protein MotB n=1 Tax=Lysobacter sp. TY2-98 TaxID=2290922 RepID=UPI000E205919|nr:flagellar motor protein MotB [Lysobacter sp. TY2-98]AXK72450.1 motility protein MotB [Lysobacter sp. TY2-98]